MKLDFSKLLGEGVDNYTENDKKASDGAIKAPHDGITNNDPTEDGEDVIKIDIDKLLESVQPQKEKEDLNRTFGTLRADAQHVRAICSEYQENGRKAQQTKAYILKGLKAGEDPIKLLLKACECISAMTGEELFYTQAKQNLVYIYGEGLAEPAPLELERDEINDRLGRLAAALEKNKDDERETHLIKVAIKEHRQKLDQIQEQLNTAIK